MACAKVFPLVPWSPRYCSTPVTAGVISVRCAALQRCPSVFDVRHLPGADQNPKAARGGADRFVGCQGALLCFGTVFATEAQSAGLTHQSRFDSPLTCFSRAQSSERLGPVKGCSDHLQRVPVATGHVRTRESTHRSPATGNRPGGGAVELQHATSPWLS